MCFSWSVLQVAVHETVCGGEVKVIGAVPETVLRAKDSRGERFVPRAEKDGRWTEGLGRPCGTVWLHLAATGAGGHVSVCRQSHGTDERVSKRP